MKIRTKEIYNCGHCNKLYLQKPACEKHEMICTKNLDNLRACYGCKFLTKAKVVVFKDGYNGEYEDTVNVLRCDKLDIFLHPAKAERTGRIYDIKDHENNPMLKVCEFRKEATLEF